MDKKQPSYGEEQLNEQLAREWAAAFAAIDAEKAQEESPPPPPAPRPRRRSPYRYVALLLTGLICYGLLIFLGALAWGGLTYMRQGEVEGTLVLPLAIFLGAIFLSACLVTLLSRGGTVYPAFMLALILNIFPFLLADTPPPQLKNISLKLLLSLLVAMSGFTISKILYLRSHAD